MKKKMQQPYNEIESLTSTSTTPLQKRVAIAIGITLLLICVIASPYATHAGPKSPVFFFITVVLAIFAALLTAYLLLGQFLGAHLPALAILSSTYLYTTLMYIPYLLAYPDNPKYSNFLSSNPNTFTWIWIFLQVGYPLGILLYIFIDRRYTTRQLSHRVTIRLLVFLLLGTPLFIFLLLFIALDPYHILPQIVVANSSHQLITPAKIVIFSLHGLLCASVFFLLRSRSVLHLWLRISTLAAFINISFSLYSGARFTIGWYVSRTNALMTATLVLCALLYEVNKLYTKLALQNEELAKQNRIQSDFLSVVGHEFRTALTSILGFSEMMHEKDLNSQDVQEYANDIHSDATRLTRMINDLLDLERMKSGRMEMNWEPIEINALIQEIVSRTYANAQSVQLQVTLDPAMPSLDGDRDKLTQVITNLLNNALKYSPASDVILIGSKREGDNAHLFVQDHGMGIPTEKLDQIFERYARVESSATRYIGGTGLGLPIVRQITEMHHGKVSVESTLGKGSTFHVMLPLTLKVDAESKAAPVAIVSHSR
jgi:signal transduction histidine kinase